MSENDNENVRDLVSRAEHVLFDFDGPICRLWAEPAARAVTDRLTGLLADHGAADLLTAEERDAATPHDVLRAVRRARPGSALEAETEARLTEEELLAAAHAYPTPYADRLIRTWHACGARLAVVAEHTPEAARRYLRGRGTADCFGPHVYGRAPAHRPDRLRRALDSLGADPERTLLIGDTPDDHRAAREAGVAFLGHAQSEPGEKQLRSAGAPHVVESLGTVLRAVWAGALL